MQTSFTEPPNSCVFEPETTKLFEESESKVPLLGIRILPHLEKSKLNLNLVDDAPSMDIVPWKRSVPVVRFDLTSFKKDTTNPEIYKQLYLQLVSLIVQELCESRGGRPELSVLTSLLASVDVKIY